MRIFVYDDADNEQGVMEDVYPDDLEQLRAELPLGWYAETERR